MSALDDVKNSAETARDSIEAARNTAEQAMNEAQNKAQGAAALGLQGVHANIDAMRAELENTASGLATAHGAASGSAVSLSEITDNDGAQHTLDRLGGVGDQLDQAHTAVDTAFNNAHQANNHAERSEINDLILVTRNVLEELANAYQSIENTKTNVQAYQASVGALSGGNV